MLRRSLCALTVVTFAACTDSRNGMQDTHSDGTTNTDLAEPSHKDGQGPVDNAPAATPTESTDAAEGVGPGLIIIETNPSTKPADAAAPAADPSTTVDSPSGVTEPR